jgi:hypothetical protein
MQTKYKSLVAAAAWIVALSILASAIMTSVHAEPSGPIVTFIANETKSLSAATIINTTGGSITTVRLNATTQNPRWKAYVGNVTGKLTLDDAGDNTIFDWSLTHFMGEVYATRTSSNINWSGINCTNSTVLSLENALMNHTNPDDNITRTFNTQTHQGFFAGTRQILQDTCFSVHTYVNSTSQNSRFEEVVLYDGTNTTNGNIVYATPLEQDVYGFDNQTYDFQMILPERGLPGWDSSTPYYFYVELG